MIKAERGTDLYTKSPAFAPPRRGKAQHIKLHQEAPHEIVAVPLAGMIPETDQVREGW